MSLREEATSALIPAFSPRRSRIFRRLTTIRGSQWSYGFKFMERGKGSRSVQVNPARLGSLAKYPTVVGWGLRPGTGTLRGIHLSLTSAATRSEWAVWDGFGPWLGSGGRWVAAETAALRGGWGHPHTDPGPGRNGQLRCRRRRRGGGIRPVMA